MTPIKPRYRLGTQHMLDLAKDDATKIPERTLFKLSGSHIPSQMNRSDVVHRSPAEFGYNNSFSVCFHVVGSNRYGHMGANDLQPLV